MAPRTRTAVAVLGLALTACGSSGTSSAPTSITGSTSAPTPSSASTTSPTTSPTASPTTSVGSSVAADPDAPVEFTGREPYPSCGHVAQSLDPMGPADTASRCLADANAAGKPAELSADDLDAIDAPSLLVYRTNADRSVDVFVVGGDSGARWQLIHCGGLVPDPQRGFELASCGDAVELD